MSSPKHSSKGSESQSRAPRALDNGPDFASSATARPASPRRVSDKAAQVYHSVAAFDRQTAELELVKQQHADSEEAVQILAKGGAEYRQQRDELLAACKAALDYATDVCPSSALPYEAKLKAAIAAAEGRAS